MAAYPPPAVRKLRVYAFDPQAASTLGSIGYAYATIPLSWEEPWEEELTRGPVNEYLEVIDVDPSSGQFYEAVDLNDPHLLAQDGLTPSEGNPQFHQQMVFAVAMKVIRLFERALGRKVIWAPRWNPRSGRYEDVPKLRIYPHALREANAYYSKEKRALLFGYFRASSADGANWIFTALSHDIIAHETTHAVLDGLHRRYAEATSIDSLAFHEAFADIVALFSHFTMQEAVLAHIQQCGGALDRESMLSGLASQFARGTTGRDTLRQFIGQKEIKRLEETHECHDRGAVLVAAVFEAFLTIYKARTEDLLRIGGVTRGEGDRMHPDLAARLTHEAAKCADRVLRMCIRALDYLPPVDVRFGEFLRAIVTADADLVPNDTANYRLAFAEAFRKRGIMASGCLSMSPDSLLWETVEHLRGGNLVSFADMKEDTELDLDVHYRRPDIIKSAEANRFKLWEWMSEANYDNEAEDRAWEHVLGVYFMYPEGSVKGEWRELLSSLAGGQNWPSVEVHSVRTTRRSGPDGQDVRQLVIEVTQRRYGYFDLKRQARVDAGEQGRGTPDFIFRGGATLIVDLREMKLRYVVRKRIDDDHRLQEQREFLQQPEGFGFTYIPQAMGKSAREPFAMIHRGH